MQRNRSVCISRKRLNKKESDEKHVEDENRQRNNGRIRDNLFEIDAEHCQESRVPRRLNNIGIQIRKVIRINDTGDGNIKFRTPP